MRDRSLIITGPFTDEQIKEFVLVAADASRMCMNPKAAKWVVDYYDGSHREVQPPIHIARTVGNCGLDAGLFEAPPQC